MDKYEYKARAEEIRRLISEKQYREAVEIADTIDWRNVPSSMMLCTVSDLYKICRRYEDSRDVLLLAYQRNPKGKMIIYSLCELSIKLNDVVNAIEYYKEYLQVAAKDTGRYILQYKLYEAQEASLEERIAILEELQKRECKEKWMYELAYLYHRVGLATSCVEECNQIIIFFGDGRYVIKALELKKLHEELSPEQEELYKQLTGTGEEEILVKDINVGKYNTIDLQKELADNLKEVLDENGNAHSTDTDTEADTTVVAGEETKVIAAESSENKVEDTDSSEGSLESEDQPVSEDGQMSLDIPGLDENSDRADTDSPKVGDPDITEVTADNNDTLIYSKEEIEKALGGSKVMDNFEDSAASTRFDEMLSLEGDGQISLVVPDQVMVEKQITGQLSIDEVLQEYERIRIENEKKWSDNVRSRINEATGNLLKDFDESKEDDLLARLEESVEKNPDSVEYGPNLTEEEKIYLKEELDAQNNAGEEVIEIIDDEVHEEEPQSDEISEIILNEPEQETEPDKEVSVEETSTDEGSAEQDLQTEEEPSAEELIFDRTPYINIEAEMSTDEKPEPASIDNTTIFTEEESDYLMKFAAAGEQKDLEDKLAREAFNQAMEKLDEVNAVTAETEPEPVTETVTETEAEEHIEPEAETVPGQESETSSENELKPEENPDLNESAEGENTESEDKQETEEVKPEDSAEETEPEAEIETEEGSGQESETEEKPESEVSKEFKTELENANDKPEEPENKKNRDPYFTDEQWERFESFLQTELGVEQVKNALRNISDVSNEGNVIIGSTDTDSAIELGKELIREQAQKGAINGKAAKIKASSLNAKDAVATLSKVYDGAIIIQDAEELRRETLEGINTVLNEPDKKMLVIMIASHRQKHRFIMDNSDMLDSFTISIDVEALDNTELVRLAKEYAYQQEFSIDEMGTLALHRRIDERQTNSHSVMLSEVKDMVDEAITHAKKKNMGHFFDLLLGKRYDDNDMVILGEKDFSE